ncbi:hypothetical protein DPMN_006823 [Dreissena polymorpha]|uniref:Uncharacterized protein n=1 Tax=Dreissena polymorpha TaxID=45954 RepID=A0A9D4MS57_DREPO|nr:hypothetical protein DPMN_006823 [Dreissena polymorpha]
MIPISEAVTVLTSPKTERDQVESSLYSDGQLQISFDALIFIIYPLNKLVTVSAFVGILPHILELPVLH